MKFRKLQRKGLLRTIFIVLVVLLLFSIMNSYIDITIEPKYNSENVLKEETISTIGVSYNYYLDISPSMLGYFETEDNTMSLLADAIQTVNKDKSTQNFYAYTYETINLPNDKDFYSYMKTSELVDSIWQDLESQKKSANMLSEFDLDQIFSEMVEDSNAVNMIITDMNFATENDDEEIYRERIENFMMHLANKSKSSNLCVYNFDSDFSGNLNFDVYYSNWKDNISVDSHHSFFIFILSNNNAAYNSYLDDLEGYLKEIQMDISKKFELRNSIFGDKHSLSVDKKKLLESSTLECFNFDNDFFKKLSNNAVGLRFYNKDNQDRASLNMKLDQFELIGDYSNIENGEKINCEIESTAKIYYPWRLGYQEYRGENIILGSSTGMEWNNKKGELNYNLEIKKDIQISHSWINKKYFIIDISFFMTNPGYIVPKWITELNAEELSDDYSKKPFIEGVFEDFVKSKNENYEDSVAKYQRYMGNLFLYMHY